MITGFHNRHVENLKYLNSDQKQYLSQFLIDTLELFKGLNIRHVSPQNATSQCANVLDVCTIIREKIAADNAAMNSIKQAKWLELNRAMASNKIGKLINLLDVLTLTNGYAANQVQASGDMVLMMMDKIVADKPLTTGLPTALLNFISTHDLINGTGVSIVQNKALHLIDAKTKKRIDPFDFRKTNRAVEVTRPIESQKRGFKSALELLPEDSKQKIAKSSSGAITFSPIAAPKELMNSDQKSEE